MYQFENKNIGISFERRNREKTQINIVRVFFFSIIGLLAACPKGNSIYAI